MTARGKIGIANLKRPRISEEYATAASYFVRPHEHFVSQCIVEPYCRNSGFEVVEREGAAARVRCLHFVLPLAVLGLDQKLRHATFVSPSLRVPTQCSLHSENMKLELVCARLCRQRKV